MAMASLPWVDGGKEFELRPIPINGQREIQELAMRYAKAQAARQNVATLKMHQYIVMARSVLRSKGAAEAKKIWDYTLEVHGLGRKEFEWSVESFEENLEQYFSKYTLPAMAATTEDEAIAAIREKTVEANEFFAEHQEDLLTFSNDYTLIEVYWTLRAARCKSIGLDDDIVALDWPKRTDIPGETETKRKAILDAVADYCTQGDLVALRKAQSAGKDDEKPLDMADLSFMDEEVVLGKSDPHSKSSTESKPVSPPSSEATGGPETKSATNVT